MDGKVFEIERNTAYCPHRIDAITTVKKTVIARMKL
jgi:hypothetical protein